MLALNEGDLLNILADDRDPQLVIALMNGVQGKVPRSHVEIIQDAGDLHLPEGSDVLPVSCVKIGAGAFINQRRRLGSFNYW